MKYSLVNKHTKEIITTVDLSDDIGVSGARTYFIGTKRLDESKFDKLWEVRYHISSKNPIKWWVEDKEISDEELKI